jgi:hypothetical protein
VFLDLVKENIQYRKFDAKTIVWPVYCRFVDSTQALRGAEVMDWITWTVEAAGILIFCIWLVVPIREFRQIFLRLKKGRGE